MSSRLRSLLSRRKAHQLFPSGTRLESIRYVVVDTELTSLDRRSNRILSIGAIAMDGRKILLGEQFYRVVNPGVAVPAETVVIHGLRPVDVLEGASPGIAVEEFLKFAGSAVLVGHFVSVDLAALHKELKSVHNILANPAIDTRRIQYWLDLRRSAHQGDRGHRVENVDLASLAKRYGWEAPEAHHALHDALLTAQLWQRLMFELESVAVRTLGDVMRIGKASR